MDGESDESERWEDFFGSSTDLSPSVIAYYDRLNHSCDSNTQRNTSESIHRSTKNSTHTDTKLELKRHNHQTKYTIKLPPPPLPKQPPRIDRRHRNFRALSANVQQLISHSNAVLDTAADVMNSSMKASNDPLASEDRIQRQFQAPKASPTVSLVGSRFKHPLSVNTSKLSQAGSELIIYDETSDTDANEIDPNKNIVENSNGHESGTEIESSVLASSNINRNITHVYEEVELLSAHESNDVFYEARDDVDAAESSSDTKEDCIYETLIPNYSASSSSLHQATNSNNSFLFSSTVQNERQTISDEPPELPPPNKSCNTQSNNVSPNKSRLYSDRDSKSSVTESDSVQTLDNKKNSQSSTGDLSRIKIRPLSTVSISSTSSSSSSGSDEHSTNQNAISYLASVESLADHSENELIPLGGSLTVRERACLEIVDSERNYVDDLGQVIKGYLNAWKERNCLKADELSTLFGNIQEVYDFNVILLAELESAGLDPARIAKCFIKMNDKFDAYTHYCTSYPDAISLLTTLLQTSHTNSLLASTQKSLQHTLPLGSYLLKPVQRILKYHLLLDNLRKHCGDAEVAQAHEFMKNVARNIDQVKRNLEQQSRVKELSGILDGWLGPELTVLGDLKLEGMLMENNKPRIVLLFQTMLIITKKKEDNRLQFKTYIHCKNLMLIEHLPGEPASFSVIPYNDVHPNQIKLVARNRDQKRQWAQHIKQVMLAHFDIPNRAKELLFQLGEEEDRTPDKNTWKWNHNTSTTPEYLERRNQYRHSEMRYRSKNQRKGSNTSSTLGIDSLDKITAPNTDPGKTKVLDSMIKELQQRNSTIKQDDNDNDSLVSNDGTTLDDNKLLKLPEDLIPFDANKSLPSKPSALDRARSKLQEVRMYNTKTLPKRIANLKKHRSKTLKETSRFYMDLPENGAETVLKITEGSDEVPSTDVKKARRRVSIDNPSNAYTNKTDDLATRKMSTVSLLAPITLAERLKNSKNKRDIDIISDLLKDQKEFDRILKKTPKKSTSLSDTERTPASQELKNSKFYLNMPMLTMNGLRLPSPPPTTVSETLSHQLNSLEKEIPMPEPIYESLLRNVHVPYKFPTPILSRSLSQPNGKYLKIKRPTEAPPKRPDSDYVTLTYSDKGDLRSVDSELVPPMIPKHGSHLRNSDTNISYNMRKTNDEDTNTDRLDNGSTDDKEELRNGSESNFSDAETSMRSTVSTTSVLSSSTISHLNEIELSLSSLKHDQLVNNLHKSVDHLNLGKTTKKTPERRSSDVATRKSISYKQGSRALGSRIASVDYADPKALFSNTNNSQMLVNKISMQNLHLHRDSGFSLTSSSDSVNVPVSSESNSTNLQSSSSTVLEDNLIHFTSVNSGSDDSYYEKNVETYLENDSIYNDSAIDIASFGAIMSQDNSPTLSDTQNEHSTTDDNNEKPYIRLEHIYSTISEVKESAKPIPPPKVPPHKVQYSTVLKPAPPPPLPAKPTHIPAIAHRNDKIKERKSLPLKVPPKPVLTKPTCTDSETQSSQMQPPPIPARSNQNASWVMKQIQNFDK